MKIGLTGSIACGKSTVSAYLRELGYPVVDADAISRLLTAPGGAALPALRRAFGDGVFHADGTLDRRALGSAVFADPQMRAQLNALLHPMIIGEVLRQLDEHDAPDALVFGDVPLLFECGMQAHFDRIWVVTASRQTQIDRLAVRDGLSEAEAIARIDSQMTQEEKIARADAVISTEGSIPQTQAQISRLLNDARQRRPQ